MPAPYQSVFYGPDAQPTASKHCMAGLNYCSHSTLLYDGHVCCCVDTAAGEATSQQTLAESAALQQAKHSHVELKEVEVVTGEEDESNVFQVTSLGSNDVNLTETISMLAYTRRLSNFSAMSSSSQENPTINCQFVCAVFAAVSKVSGKKSLLGSNNRHYRGRSKSSYNVCFYSSSVFAVFVPDFLRPFAAYSKSSLRNWTAPITGDFYVFSINCNITTGLAVS